MKRYIVATLITVMTACTVDIPYTGPGTDPMMVLNAYSNDGDTVWVKASHSVFFLDPDTASKNLPDANVTIEIDGVERTATYYPHRKAYTDGRVAQSGNHVRVSASHAKYGNAYAEDYVPIPDSICVMSSTAKVNDKKDNDENYFMGTTDSIWTLTVSLQGASADAHYYKMTIIATTEITYLKDDRWGAPYWNTIYDAIRYSIHDNTRIALGLTDTEDIIDNGFETEYEYGAISFMFSDQMLNDNKELSFNICMQKGYHEYPYGFDEPVENDTTEYQYNYFFDIELTTITEATYQYLKSYDDYEESEWSLFSEPVQVVGNVNGGLGVLTSSATHYTKVKY